MITDWLHELPRFSPEPGLGRMRALLGALGNPERAYRHLHIAGTNGKGSTTAMIASILRSAGFTVGRYTSPHLSRWEERIAVNGEPIDADTFQTLLTRVRAAAEAIARHPGDGIIQFEALTAAAFRHFRDRACDIAVLEVGLGGRFDATNVIESPAVTVITSIGHDHTQILGEDLAAIAREKAGIVKAGAPVVTAVRDDHALAAIRNVARSLQAPTWVVSGDQGATLADVRWRRLCQDRDGQAFDVALPGGRHYGGLRLRLLGGHQVANAACAVAAATLLGERTGLDVPDSAISEGLELAVWPGRVEVVRRSPWVVIDGAHNPEGAAALRDTMEELFPGSRPVLVLGMLGDKAAGKVAAVLAGLARKVIVTRPDYPSRALDPVVLADLMAAHGDMPEVREPVDEALRRGLELLDGSSDVLLVAGSLYLAAEARALLVRPLIPASPP